MELSIIIVEYKNTDIIKEAITSIQKHFINFDYEIFVISNSDYSEDVRKNLSISFPNVHFIFNQKNLGFAKANNQGIKQSNSEFVLLINPDTKVVDNGISYAINLMKTNSKIAVIGPKIFDKNGKVQDSCREFITINKLIFRALKRTINGKSAVLEKIEYSKTQPVDWISGACILVRRSAIDDVGLMDERYFMYDEDMDWCRRFWQHGWEVWYLPHLMIEHNATRKSANYLNLFNKLLWVHMESHLKYFHKWGLSTNKKILDNYRCAK